MGYIGIILGVFGLDFLIKEKMEKRLQSGENYPIIDKWIYLCKCHNKGFSMSLLNGRPGIVAAVSLIVVCVIGTGVVLLLGEKGNSMIKVALSLILGGGFSNTYDRIRRKYVIDYIHFPKLPGKLGDLVFNVSDFFIILGAILLWIGEWKQI